MKLNKEQKKIQIEQLEEEWRLLYIERREHQKVLDRVNKRISEIEKILNGGNNT